MRPAASLVGVCCCLLTAGSHSRPDESIPAYAVRSAVIATLIDQANHHYISADYEKARQLYSKGLEQLAKEAHDDRASMLLGIANCELMTHQYPAALRSYKDAAALARSRDTMLRVAAGRASVYRRLGNYPAAFEAMREVEPHLGPGIPAMLLLQAANIWRDMDMSRAGTLYRRAIQESAVQDNRAGEALAWNQLGFALLLAGDLPAAEQALTEGFRLRKIGAAQHLQTSYVLLAILKRRQGDLVSASNLLRRALDEREQQFPPSALHYERAMIERAAGRPVAALAAFEAAADAAREWRLRVPPAQDFRATAEIGIQQIYADYVEAAVSAYRTNPDPRLLEKSFSLAERSRTHLLEEALSHEGGYPPEYWRALTQFRRALSLSLVNPDEENERILNAHRLHLAELEAHANGGITTRQSSHQRNERTRDGFPLRSLQKRLRESETLFSFHIGQRVSYRWTVNRDAISLEELPSGPVISRAVAGFREALLRRDGSASRNAHSLYKLLFENIGEEAEASRAWILSLDGPLFELPFSALVSRADPQVRYLIDDRSVRLAPGVAVLMEGTGRTAHSGRFVGIADPIYNAADRRRREQGGNMAQVIGLPRIPGSAREVQAASEAWRADAEPKLLTGRQVTRQQLADGLSLEPAILHVATHVVRHPAARDQVLIALGLQETGEMDYLGPTEIAAVRRPMGLVTLSGCGSGEGATLPGLGLFGLTRAWLIAGARTVAATYWPVVDDEGSLVSELYRRLSRGRRGMTAPDVAEALRDAQIAMRRSGTSTADPAYWAAYFVLGKD